MAGVPSGTVTFLFTDIEGSTKLAQEYPDEMPALLARHNEILHQSIEAHNGYVFQIVGDSFSAAFHSASDALNAALNADCKTNHGLQHPSKCGWGFTRVQHNSMRINNTPHTRPSQ